MAIDEVTQAVLLAADQLRIFLLDGGSYVFKDIRMGDAELIVEAVRARVDGLTPRDSDDSMSSFVDLLSSDDVVLPPGWEQRIANDRVFFINHNDRTTHWSLPEGVGAVIDPISPPHEPPKRSSVRRGRRARARRRASTDSNYSTSITTDDEENYTPDPALPAGWERRKLEDGRAFYVDHINRRTAWNLPGEDSTGQQRTFGEKVAHVRRKLQHATGETMLMVKRDTLLSDSLRQVSSLSSPQLRRRFRVKLDDDAGLDYGGLSREYFTAISEAICDPTYGMFAYTVQDSYSLYINVHSGSVQENHLEFFNFVGRIIGLAILNQKLCDMHFISPFYKVLLGRPLVIEDLAMYDLELYNSVTWMLDNDASLLCRTFCVEEEFFGARHTVELKANGSEIDVTDANKREFIGLLVRYKLYAAVEEQFKAVISGLEEVVSVSLLQRVFDSAELEYFISGLHDLNVDDWMANTRYRGDFSADHPVIKWFWKIVREYDPEHKARLLHFTTGTSRIPVGGFAELFGSNKKERFTIECVDKPQNWFPRAHTCFNRIELPKYKSEKLLRKQLKIALECADGFDLE